MKKLFILLLGAIIILAGCSKSSTDEPLVVWAMGAEGEMLSQMTAQFTEETGIEVEVVPIPWDQARDKLLTAVASQEGPDVVQLGSAWVAEFAEAGALADLSVYQETYPETFNPDTYFEGIASYMTYNSTMVSVPWYVDTRVLYYRTDLLEEVGYTEAPKTWEELYDCATKLVEQGVSEYGFKMDKLATEVYLSYAWSYGWTFFDEEGNPNFDDPIFVQTLEYFNQFIVDGLSPQEDDVDILESFSTGRFPMFISGPWMIGSLQTNYPELEGKWDIALLPAGSTQTSFMGGTCWAIWEWSENKDNAAAFIDWMNQPAQQVAWYGIANVLPSNTVAWDDPILADDSYMSVFGEQLETAMAPPSYPEYETSMQIIKEEADKYYYGQQDVNATVTNINSNVSAKME